MSHTNCNKDCELCPFVVDPNNPQRQVCVKCGHSYTFEPINAISVIAIIVLAILITFGLHKESHQNHQDVKTSPAVAQSKTELYPPEVTQPAPEVEQPVLSSVISQTEAEELVRGWHQAESRVLAPPFDRQLAATLTTDRFYRNLTRPDGWMDQFSQNKTFYQYSLQELRLRRFEASFDRAWVEVWVTEDHAFRNQPRTYLVRYDLKRVGQQWKIADRSMRRLNSSLTANTALNS
jgi:hypothetical protein